MPKKPLTASFEGKRVTARGARHLAARGPKLREEPKSCVLLRGTKTSEKSSEALKALRLLKAPFAKALNRRRDEVKVFEDAAAVERLCARHDAAFFGIASHSKKRPDNVVLGRLFDGSVLDMFEFGVVSSKVSAEALAKGKLLGSKPLVVFVGADWEASEKGKRLKNFFADFFRGPDVDKINLAGLDTVLVLTTTPGKDSFLVQVAPCRLDLRRSSKNSDVPAVKLRPATDEALVLAPRRDHAPALDLWKAALKQPKQHTKKRKNVSRNTLGETLGTIHLGRQDLDSLHTRKVKALRRSTPGQSAPDPPPEVSL